VLGVGVAIIVIAIVVGFLQTILIASSISRSMMVIEDVASDVSQSANQINTGVLAQRVAIEEISASLEELIASIQEVAQNTSHVSGLANESADHVKSGARAVEQSIKSMNLIRKSSQNIMEINGVMSSIAEQTNLLALNASIEAARAKEHRKGFAVVADEVRKLAEKSAGAAEQISRLIKESNGRIEEGASLSTKVEEKLAAIVKSVNYTADRVVQISAATEEQAATSSSIKDGMTRIGDRMEQNAQFAQILPSTAYTMVQEIKRVLKGKGHHPDQYQVDPNVLLIQPHTVSTSDHPQQIEHDGFKRLNRPRDSDCGFLPISTPRYQIVL
ncbi:hypothetical protein KKA14_15145, partial [bacterium]|nr:hypothetical protein [bacterium]